MGDARPRDQDLLSIGQLARCARCSVKALRHYAELGLLVPAQVDPSSGYRYYRRGQVRQALTISLLRQLGLPLASVRELLDANAREPRCGANSSAWRATSRRAGRPWRRWRGSSPRTSCCRTRCA